MGVSVAGVGDGSALRAGRRNCVRSPGDGLLHSHRMPAARLRIAFDLSGPAYLPSVPCLAALHLQRPWTGSWKRIKVGATVYDFAKGEITAEDAAGQIGEYGCTTASGIYLGAGAGGRFEARRGLDADLGYGLGFAQAPGVLTPYAGLTLGDGRERSWRTGARWAVAPGAALALEGTAGSRQVRPPNTGSSSRCRRSGERRRPPSSHPDRR